jgi:hypothetical protein
VNLALFAGLHLLRDAPAVLDGVLAARLGLGAEALRKVVAEDPACFPEELVFHLTEEERQHLPEASLLAFTEVGAALLAAKLPDAPVLEALKELAAARGNELKAIGDIIKAANKEAEETKPEHPIGFVGEALPHGLKAKEKAERGKP